MVGEHEISITVLDPGHAPLTKKIIGEVVDSTVIGPEYPPAYTPATYVYGTPIQQTISEAYATASGGDVAILIALHAGASKSWPTGAITHPAVKIVADLDNYIACQTDADETNDVGIFRFTVSDIDDEYSITLTITVGTGGIPVVTAFPKPLNIPLPVAAASIDGFGNLTRDKLMEGVIATDLEAESPSNPTGDVRAGVIITIVDVTGDTPTPVSAIPADVPGVYQVTYTYTDEDRNTAFDSRAVIVNDGTIKYDDEYILRALSFVILSSDVATIGADTQLQTLSEARAWTVEGAERSTDIPSIGSYHDSPGDYNVTIQVLGHPALQTTVIAKVLDDRATTTPNQNQNGANGAQYSLVAANFRISALAANALVALEGTPDFEDAFLTRSNAKAFNRTSVTFAQAMVGIELTDDGGFATSGTLAQGDSFIITLVAEVDTATTTTIIVFIDNGTPPWIDVPELKSVVLDSSFGEAKYLEGVTYGDEEDPLELLVVTHDYLVDTSVKGALYPVTYTVTDTDGNMTSATGYVFVGAVYNSIGVDAWSFVTTVKNVQNAVSLDDLILSRSKAQAIEAVTALDGTVSIEDIPSVVHNDASLAAVVDTYTPIRIGVSFADDPFVEISARVIDKDEISNDPDPLDDIHDVNTDDPDDKNRYVVAANHVTLTWAQAGSLEGRSDIITEATLIYLAEAEALRVTPLGAFSPMNARVTANNILQATGSYDVTFIPEGVGGVSVTVQFTVVGMLPVITVDGPLRIAQTESPATLTRTQLLQGVDVFDSKRPTITKADLDITNKVGVFPTIDTSKVGVHRVTYSIEDPIITQFDGSPTVVSAKRAVIVDDGRFVIDEYEELIIGAKNFVVSIDDPGFDGTVADAIRLSWAEAYDFEGEEMDVELISPLPPGFAAKDLGVYAFTFGIVGSDSPTITITGEIVDADVIDEGDDPYNAKYAILASHFTMLAEDAAAIVGSDAGLIAAAKARVVKLIPSATVPNKDVVLHDDGGFKALKGIYGLTFGISGVDRAERSADVNGTVTDDQPPVLSLSTPFEVALGAVWDRPLAMTDVSAIDLGDGIITDWVIYDDKDPGSPLDTDTPGIYQVIYSVTDSDGNSVSKERSVVVNDGRYEVGNGRVLEAGSFVIKTGDVPANASLIKAHLLGMTDAKVYDGETGTQLAPTATMPDIASTGGYSRTVGEYNIIVSTPDTPGGSISKPVKGKVVDADVIDHEPLDPTDPGGSKVYVYGKNVTLYVPEALLITTDEELLAALKASAIVVDTKGDFLTQAVIVVDDDGFDAVPGSYKVKVADIDSLCEIELTVTVISGSVPKITPERPIIVPISPVGGTLTDAQKKGSSTAWDDDDGNLTSSIVVTGSVPANVAGVYPVTLKVTNSHGMIDEVSTIVVIDDGNFVFGDDYIVYAKDFSIDKDEVDTSNLSTQIRTRSSAYAISNDGTVATAVISDFGGYTDAGGTYHPRVTVAEEPTLSRQITATVIAPAALWRLTFDPNGGILSGPSAIYIQEPNTKLSYLPVEPRRTNYEFLYWRTPSGAQFTVDTPVTSNMTLTAQWQRLPDPPDPVINVTVTPPPVIVNPPAVTVNPPAVTVNPPAVTVNPPAVTVNPPAVNITNPPASITVETPPIQQGDTYVTVTDPDKTDADPTKVLIPEQVSPEDMERYTPHWSLFDLCAVVLTLLLAVFFLLRFLITDRKKQKEYDEEAIDWASLSAMPPERQAAILANLEADREAQFKKQRAQANKEKAIYVNTPVLLFTTAAFIEALIILLTTQDFTAPMVLLDEYSVLLSVIAFVQLSLPIIAAVLWNRKNRQVRENSAAAPSPRLSEN
ncbi:MAG: InlB B-repeat-containing protein [Coriobacteriia bacterium]|nr:InlB B-repeat-containing protein [Coriobacteriia bacterium]